jgi:hypothetical protein
MLMIKGAIVTLTQWDAEGDATPTSRTGERIRLGLKGNQANVHEEIKTFFEDAYALRPSNARTPQNDKMDFHQTIGKGTRSIGSGVLAIHPHRLVQSVAYGWAQELRMVEAIR